MVISRPAGGGGGGSADDPPDTTGDDTGTGGHEEIDPTPSPSDSDPDPIPDPVGADPDPVDDEPEPPATGGEEQVAPGDGDTQTGGGDRGGFMGDPSPIPDPVGADDEGAGDGAQPGGGDRGDYMGDPSPIPDPVGAGDAGAGGTDRGGYMGDPGPVPDPVGEGGGEPSTTMPDPDPGPASVEDADLAGAYEDAAAFASDIQSQTGLDRGGDFTIATTGDGFQVEYTESYQREAAAADLDEDFQYTPIGPGDVERTDDGDGYRLTDRQLATVREHQTAAELGVQVADIEVGDDYVAPLTDDAAESLAVYSAQQGAPGEADVDTEEISPGVYRATVTGTGGGVQPTGELSDLTATTATPGGQRILEDRAEVTLSEGIERVRRVDRGIEAEQELVEDIQDEFPREDITRGDVEFTEATNEEGEAVLRVTLTEEASREMALDRVRSQFIAQTGADLDEGDVAVERVDGEYQGRLTGSGEEALEEELGGDESFQVNIGGSTLFNLKGPGSQVDVEQTEEGLDVQAEERDVFGDWGGWYGEAEDFVTGATRGLLEASQDVASGRSIETAPGGGLYFIDTGHEDDPEPEDPVAEGVITAVPTVLHGGAEFAFEAPEATHALATSAEARRAAPAAAAGMAAGAASYAAENPFLTAAQIGTTAAITGGAVAGLQGTALGPAARVAASPVGTTFRTVRSADVPGRAAAGRVRSAVGDRTPDVRVGTEPRFGDEGLVSANVRGSPEMPDVRSSLRGAASRVRGAADAASVPDLPVYVRGETETDTGPGALSRARSRAGEAAARAEDAAFAPFENIEPYVRGETDPGPGVVSRTRERIGDAAARAEDAAFAPFENIQSYAMGETGGISGLPDPAAPLRRARRGLETRRAVVDVEFANAPRIDTGSEYIGDAYRRREQERGDGATADDPPGSMEEAFGDAADADTGDVRTAGSQQMAVEAEAETEAEAGGRRDAPRRQPAGVEPAAGAAITYGGEARDYGLAEAAVGFDVGIGYEGAAALDTGAEIEADVGAEVTAAGVDSEVEAETTGATVGVVADTGAGTALGAAAATETAVETEAEGEEVAQEAESEGVGFFDPDPGTQWREREDPGVEGGRAEGADRPGLGWLGETFAGFTDVDYAAAAAGTRDIEEQAFGEAQPDYSTGEAAQVEAAFEQLVPSYELDLGGDGS